MKRLLLVIVPLIALFGMNGLGTSAQSKLKVVATTSIIADVARHVGGDLVEVTSLIPPESDVHGYIATPRDIALLVDADVVLVNGLGMEEGLLDIVAQNAPDAHIVSLGINVLSSDHHHHDDEAHADEEHADEEAGHNHVAPEYLGVYGKDVMCDLDHDDHADEHDHSDEEGHDHTHGACDPHVWYDVDNVIIWTQNIARIFSTQDPANATTYGQNAANYIIELMNLKNEIRALIGEIPAENRVIVTNHNFLAYFAAVHEFEVVGTVIPSASSMAQVAPQDIANLVETIRDEGVRAIFAEYSLSTDLAETVAREVGFEVKVVRLYSGSLGAEGSPASTYIDFMRYNANAIAEALKG